ncbi:S8 family peptidase [Actinophytocola sediminis]
MPIARRLLCTVLAVAAAVGWTAVPGQAAAPPVGSGYLGAVTLVTGDHVSVRRVGDHLVPRVSPAPGREHVHFATTSVADSLLVVPADAWASVRTGVLDRRLFDVLSLLRDGFGDASRADLPLIVQGTPAEVTTDGATVSHTLSTVDAVAVRQPKGTTAGFWAAREPTRRIWLDGLRRPSLDVSVPRIGAPAAWRAGYTGARVPVAVLDTGIDDTHRDLRGRVAAKKNFTADRNTRDTDGHGTHVASTIAGTGAASRGRNTGVAPGANLLVGKVCQGSGCAESAILAGMEWAAGAGAKVVNLSIGGQDTAGDDPLELAIERLSARHGTLFVVAAGNDGGLGAETVSSPASADAALAVGAVDDQDALASFSGRGPRVADGALKPEIVAPGVDIVAARSRFSERGERGEDYVSLSGTSMATPHVTGAAAILAQRHPDWTGARIKAALVGSAEPLADAGTYEQGGGRVDVARGVGQLVYTEPSTVSLGRMSWPHADDPAESRTVTYHNTGERQTVLRLTLPARGPGGEPVPAGMFSLSTTSLTVPAGGAASVTLTVNTAVPAAEGAFGAHLLATAEDGTRVATPVAVDREPESYDLTLRTLDATGAPTDDHFSFVFGIDQQRYRPVPGIDGTGTLRVRAGRYHVDAAIGTPHPGGTLSDSAKVVRPTVDVRADTTVVLDARAARPVSVTFDREDVVPAAVAVAYSRNLPHGLLNTGVLGDTFDRIGIGQVGAPAPEEELVASIGGVWAVPDRRGELLESTLAYHLSWFEYDSVPTGFARHVVDADLAEVPTTYRAQANRKLGTKMWLAREPRTGVANGFGFGFRLPLARTEFHNVDGLEWSGELQQWSMVRGQVHTETVLTGGPVDHQPGKHPTDAWNAAVFGPGYTAADPVAIRSGDVLSFTLPMFADAGLDRSGVSEVESAATALYRDGVLVGRTEQPGAGSFEVPAEPADYRLVATATRDDVSTLSTSVSSEWTFTSVRPPEDRKGKGGTGLPLLAVRYAPPGLDLDNAVDARSIRIPVTVEWPAEAPAATLAALTVEASFDDGRSWRPLAVTIDGPAAATAEITHPAGRRHVSLRANATDSGGNTVTQTILRAYRSR